LVYNTVNLVTFFKYDRYHPFLSQFIAYGKVMTSYIEKINKLFKASKC